MSDNLLNVSPGNKETVGVFTTSQSLVTFPVASSLVTIIWKVLGRAVESTWAKKDFVALIVALVIGLTIYSISEVKGASRREKITGFVISLANSFALAATALGIDTVINPR